MIKLTKELKNTSLFPQVFVFAAYENHQCKNKAIAVREIDVSIDQPDAAAVRLSVRDHGPGISEGDLPKLFNPFFTTKQNGMGMGLAISRSAIEASGGSLTARNHPAGGAVFEFQLPLYKAGA